jgi:hypothetical protein
VLIKQALKSNTSKSDDLIGCMRCRLARDARLFSPLLHSLQAPNTPGALREYNWYY